MNYLADSITSPSHYGNQILRHLHPVVIAKTEAKIAEIGWEVVRDPATDLLDVNGEFSVSLVLARCQATPAGSHR